MKWSDIGWIVVAILVGPRALAIQEPPVAPQEAYSVKVSTSIVPLDVSVTRRDGGFVLGLEKEEFKVFEDGMEQPISFFSSEKEPVSWGLVLDRSGSMSHMIRSVHGGATHIIDGGAAEDEMFIVTFNNHVELVSDFTTDRSALQTSILGLKASGSTALWDAIGFGLERIERGKHQKRVLVVVTDGEDNSSRLSFRDLMDRAKEQHVLIYSVGMFGIHGGNSSQLSQLARATGARAHYPGDLRQCWEAMKEIANDVGRQYSLGYYPSNTKRDGTWRKIRVVVQRLERKGKYVVRTRAGYYAPKEGTG